MYYTIVMKLIIGLGNPGEKYRNHRHNVGFMVVDALAEKLGVSEYELSKKGRAQYAWVNDGKEKIELFKPQTFMNDSGFSVAYAKKKHKDFKISDIYIIHDDLDLSLGTWKISWTKGPKVHGGINDIEQKLRTDKFWRVRIGVDNRGPKNKVTGKAYVLQNFSEEEVGIIKEVIEKVIMELLVRVKEEK